jgi:hypothetical protein
MTWCRSTSSASIAARFFAIAIVLVWTIVPGVCGGLFEAEHTHAEIGAHEHADSVTDHASQHKELIPCCRSLASVKFLTAAASDPSPNKAVLIAVFDTAANSENVTALASKPVAAATGPPRTRSTRYFSYSPLAPPARTA